MTTANIHGMLTLIPLDSQLDQPRYEVLVRDERFNVRQLLLPGGEEAAQAAPGDLLIHCHEGAVTLVRDSGEQRLNSGELYLLAPREKCVIRADKPSSLLLTMVATEQEFHGVVDQASEESFPASDPPGWTGATG